MTRKKPDIQRVFQALGDPTRRVIMEKLTDGPVSVSQLSAPLNMTLAAVVQHIQVLEGSGLVRTEKTGRVRTCRIDPAGLDVVRQWVDARGSLWEKRFDQLGDLLAETKASIPGAEDGRPTGRSSKHSC
jgi:DNA-binding transcriptional ArsR family regulator